MGKAGASSPQNGSAARYFPFGDWRTEPVQTITSLGYTGHRHDNQAAVNDLGLIYMNARYYLPGLGRFASPDTLVPDPANLQAFNRYAYTVNNPINFTDPTGHRECGASDGCIDPLPQASPFLQALVDAWVFYEDNFVKPFEGEQNLSQEFGPTQWSRFHDGIDWSGNFTVRVPASGTVTKAGLDSPAGMWQLENVMTGEIRTWTNLTVNDRDANGLMEPERLLTTGEWQDNALNWSHSQGTIIKIDHGNNLETVYYHTAPSIAEDTTVNQGETLGVTANTGWSTGTHLHYTVNFTYNGNSIHLNPLAPPASIRHLLTP